MLFLCFSVKDRMPLINNFNQYIENFGVKTWYDRRDIFLGDDRYDTNIKFGASNPNIKYAVVFYSDNFAHGNICIDEFKILEERYYKKEIHIFPVFLGEIPTILNEQFQLCSKLVYKQIKSSEDFLNLSLHIVAKIIKDSIKTFKIKTLHEFINVLNKESIIYELLKEYETIDKNNFSMRISFLFSMYKVLTYNRESKYMYFKTMHFLFYINGYTPLVEEKREFQIMEDILIAELNGFFSES